AECKIIGEENSQVLYFFYKEPIKNQVKNYISDEANRSSVLQNMKGTEYSDYITELSKTIDITVSKAVSKYTPEMFED
ncbi:MAG: hypothetical protein IKB73_02780, partial [Ruminococcus sp.]|nr:hypothetical protein [Ruminococcus sp.]